MISPRPVPPPLESLRVEQREMGRARAILSQMHDVQQKANQLQISLSTLQQMAFNEKDQLLTLAATHLGGKAMFFGAEIDETLLKATGINLNEGGEKNAIPVSSEPVEVPVSVRVAPASA